MPSFKELDPQAIRSLLDVTDEKGNKLHPDVITPLVEKEKELFSKSPCPKCGADAAVPMLDLRRPFTTNSPLANKILRCPACDTEYDPKTGLVLSATLIYGRG